MSQPSVTGRPKAALRPDGRRVIPYNSKKK